MENFKKGFMTTMGVLFGMGLWMAVSEKLSKSEKKKDEKEAEKTE